MAASCGSGLEHPPKTDKKPGTSLPCSGAGCPTFMYSHEKAYLHFISQCDKLKAVPSGVYARAFNRTIRRERILGPSPNIDDYSSF